MRLHPASWIPNDDPVRAVEAGQVMCPSRGVVDIERCWVCPAYAGLSTGRIEGVICKPDQTMDTSFGPTFQ